MCSILFLYHELNKITLSRKNYFISTYQSRLSTHELQKKWPQLAFNAPRNRDSHHSQRNFESGSSSFSIFTENPGIILMMDILILKIALFIFSRSFWNKIKYLWLSKESHIWLLTSLRLQSWQFNTALDQVTDCSACNTKDPNHF